MKKLKKIAAGISVLLALSAFISCSNSDDDDAVSDVSLSGGSGGSSDGQNEDSQKDDANANQSKTSKNKTPVIYLAGDSTVKTYETEQYIAGWGQYIGTFFDSSVKVVNCAQGGRSSRSFINEGRLYDIDDTSYSYKFTQNDGKSIGSVIKSGDFLFIQFGHNDDDTKKTSSYSTMYNRMVPLGEASADGTFPTTAGTKTATTYLPSEYTSNVSSSEQAAALAEIAKYGSEYYAYDSGGTYKWFLKQYIDFARSKGAIPVLVTPVARVKFDLTGTEIIGGAGLHGENFAYVQAVRQLAKEEDCLLLDLFAESKTLLETATKTYADYLMALVPNDLTGEWPSGYDSTYGNTAAGFTKIEATHYNKYGAFLTAAKAVEEILANSETHNGGSEYFNFTSHINTTPSEIITPPNLISKSTVAKLEALFSTVTVKNDSVTYPDPAEVVAKITAIEAKGEVTTKNYKEFKTLCEEAMAAYVNLNVDDRSSVTNLSVLESYEAKVAAIEEELAPKPTETVVLNFENMEAGTITETTTISDGFKVVATSAKKVTIEKNPKNITYSGTTYELAKDISLGGSATFSADGNRYLEFSTKGACKVTVFAASSGSDARTLNLVSSSSPSTIVATFAAPASATANSAQVESAGTYWLGSAGNGIRVFQILIEYFE